MVDTLEDQGIGRQETVEQAVDKRHVNSDQQNDRLTDEQSDGTGEVFGDKLVNVDFDFLLFRMDTPILSSASQLSGFANKDNRCIGFPEEKYVEQESNRAHNTGEEEIPSPAEIRRLNETSDERAEHRSHENAGGEDDNSYPTLGIVEHIGEYSGDDRQRTRAEEASPEATDHDSLNVFPSSTAKCETEKAEHADADW